MVSKLFLLSSLVVGTTSFLTWGAIEANNTHNKHKYKQKIEQYSKWRKEFYEKELYDQVQMCSSPDIKACSSENNEYKSYLPKSDSEDSLWEKLYKRLESNKESDSVILSNISSSQSLKDYCYLEIKEAIDRYKKSENKEKDYFNVGGNQGDGRKHDICVLEKKDLSKK